MGGAFRKEELTFLAGGETGLDVGEMPGKFAAFESWARSKNKIRRSFYISPDSKKKRGKWY